LETPAVAKVEDVIKTEKKLETGKCFGHYEIIKQIGTGGMGRRQAYRNMSNLYVELGRFDEALKLAEK